MRPRKIKTPEEFRKKVDAFFKHREKEGKPPTVSGLAIFLGFADRQSIYDYGSKKGEVFACIVKEAIARIEDFAEQRILSGDGNATGAIFWLKNHKWTDKTEQTVDIRSFSLFEQEVEDKAKKYADTQRNTESDGK